MEGRMWDQRILSECSWDAPELALTRRHDPHYLQNPIRTNTRSTNNRHSLVRNSSQSPDSKPREDNQSYEGKPHDADADISIDKDMFYHLYSFLNDSVVLIGLSIHTELRPSAWALRTSSFIQNNVITMHSHVYVH
jgi:hypothetical protein